MSNIKDWSTTAASNNSASPNGFPENMAPNGVNDSAREVMAAVRAFYEAAEWRDWGHNAADDNLARTGNTTFELSGDWSSLYNVGRRCKFTDSATLYGRITAVDYNVTKAGYTTVTVSLDSGNLSASLTAVEVGQDSTNLPYSEFDAGTLMVFQQTAAPTGWTKQTTHNDKTLRVVSGTASSGGSSPFSTVFGLTATNGHTLDLTEIPLHDHGIQYTAVAAGGGANASVTGWTTGTPDVSSEAVGGGDPHSHNIDLRVEYVDLIIASKD